MRMFRRAVFAGCAALLLLCSSQPARAQLNNTYHRKIEGTVYYAADGTPADHVIIELRSAEGTDIDHFTTDERGTFYFTNLSAASYRLSINLQDYEPVDSEVDLTIASAEGVVVNLVKRAAKGTGNAAGHPGSGTISAHLISMPKKAQDAFSKGQHDLYQSKDANAGLKDFQEAVKVAPAFYEAYEQMAMAYLTLKEPAQAEKAVRKSIETSGDTFAPADVDLSSLLMDKNQYAEGEKFARRGVALDANSWLGEYELSRALFYLGHVPDALACAQKSRQLNPSFPNIYRLLAIIHIKQKDKAALIADLDQYIKLDPDSPAGLRAKQMRAGLGPAPPAVKQSSAPTLATTP